MSEEKVGGARKRATRFFWCTLILATGASVCGNVAHAVLAQPEHAPIAATAAVVPPVVLLGATHGVALLVRSRAGGAVYWCALTLTVALAGCAFVLSFDALRALALTWAGFPASTAWLWPLAIDLSIAQSTLALLALSGAPRRTAAAHNGAEAAQRNGVANPQVNPGASLRLPSEQGFSGVSTNAQVSRPSSLRARNDQGRNGASVHNGVHLHQLGAPVEQPDWLAKADELIEAGVTRIDRGKAAAVLAELDGGIAPSTVARKHKVGYATVARISDARATSRGGSAPTHLSPA
jgi:hypothetical protein